MPQRIQRSRAKGWRMPAGAIYVGRPTRWGNAWRVNFVTHLVAADGLPAGARRWFASEGADMHWVEDRRAGLALATRLYRDRLGTFGQAQLDQLLAPLHGRDLVCWCPLVDAAGNPVPCHADVLLELANG